jgi:hypothetical protein
MVCMDKCGMLSLGDCGGDTAATNLKRSGEGKRLRLLIARHSFPSTTSMLQLISTPSG